MALWEGDIGPLGLLPSSLSRGISRRPSPEPPSCPSRQRSLLGVVLVVSGGHRLPCPCCLGRQEVRDSNADPGCSSLESLRVAAEGQPGGSLGLKKWGFSYVGISPKNGTMSVSKSEHSHECVREALRSRIWDNGPVNPRVWFCVPHLRPSWPLHTCCPCTVHVSIQLSNPAIALRGGVSPSSKH